MEGLTTAYNTNKNCSHE